MIPSVLINSCGVEQVAALQKRKEMPAGDAEAVKHKKRLKVGSRADSSRTGHIGIDNGDGMVFYEVAVLIFMLIEIYNYNPDKASKMCFGFGLDKRPQSLKRAKSCRTQKAEGHSAQGVYHDFPKEYSFSVQAKYEEFKTKYHSRRSGRSSQDFR